MLKLTDLTEDQLEWARTLHNDPEVLAMLTDPTVVSPEQQVAWFAKLQSSSKSRRLVATLNGNPVGVVRLDDIDLHNHSVCVGLDIEKSYRGQGLAKPIYRELFQYLFQDLTMNRVWLLVAAYNKRAHRLYTELGFVEEGKFREALYKDNQYHDYILMSILRDEWITSGAY